MGIKKKTNEEFIKEANKVHTNRYFYNKTKYINAKTKVIITCNLHGDFEQKPNNHTNGQGCKECALLMLSSHKKLTNGEFIEKSKKLHGDMYDYSKVEYINSHFAVTIGCKLHGFFERTPNSHLQGQGCRVCGLERSGKSRRLKNEDFIKKANEVHNNHYLYNKTSYIKSNVNIIITCPTHGDFYQKPNGHLNGRGCIDCFIDKGNFTKNSFKNKAKGRECTFYILRCFNEHEEFYKIGITSRGIEKRFSNKFFMPYNYEIEYQYKATAEIIYDLEKIAHKKSKRYNYTPMIKFKYSSTPSV